MEKEEVLKVYRHSLAHILAKAVIELYGKEVQYAIGPEIEDGCYYDFVLPRTVTEEDFPAITGHVRSSPVMRLWNSSRIRSLSMSLLSICLQTRQYPYITQATIM